MSRPRTVDPHGRTRITSVVLSEPVHTRLKREADRRGISMGALVREKLDQAS
jgi:hypothetical protein